MIRILLLVSVVALLAGPARGDEDAARFFTDRGRKALEAGDLDEAESQFEKALQESPGHIPALLGHAETALAGGAVDRGVMRLEKCLDRARAGGGGKEGAEAREAARSLLKDLDRWRFEYREIIDEYISGLMLLARKSSEKNPELARKCIDRIFKVAPGDQAAEDLRSKLLGGDAGSLSGGSIQPVGREKLLFDGKDLENWTGKPPHFVVENGIVVATARNEGRYMRTLAQLGDSYRLTVECRVRKTEGKEPIIDVGFGWRGKYEHWTFGIARDRLMLLHFGGTPESQKVHWMGMDADIPITVEAFQWHTYGISIKGDEIACDVDGTEVCRVKVPPESLAGVVAITVQNCIAEFRKIAYEELK